MLCAYGTYVLAQQRAITSLSSFRYLDCSCVHAGRTGHKLQVSLLKHVNAQAWVLPSATHIDAQAYKPGVKDYNYTQIADPAALKTGTLNYSDATGANLTV